MDKWTITQLEKENCLCITSFLQINRDKPFILVVASNKSQLDTVKTGESETQRRNYLDQIGYGHLKIWGIFLIFN